MPVRQFDGVDDRITVAIGSLNFAFGSGSGSTMAFIVRRLGSTGTRTIFHAGTATGSSKYSLEATNGVAPLARIGLGNVSPPTIQLSLNDDLEIIAVSKATGTVVTRWHHFDFGTGVWTHENSSGTAGNSGTPATSAFFGAGPSAQFWDGDLAGGAVWTVILSDAEVEALSVSWASWLSVAPVARWLFDQASVATPLPDDVGAADETAITGTSVVTEDIPWTGLVFSLGPVTETGTVLPLAYTKTRVLGPLVEAGSVLPLAFTHDAPPPGSQHVQSGDGVRQPDVDSILAA